MIITDPRTPTLTARQRTGIVIAGVYAAINVALVFTPPPEGEVAPPVGILVVGALLGLLGVGAAVAGWRGSRVALRVLAGCIILATVTALPAFFVDVPVEVKVAVAVAVLVTVAALVLMFSSGPRPSPVLD